MTTKILDYDSLLPSIFSGWKDASDFIQNSQDENNEFHFRPEYLITVMVAGSILKNEIISTQISDYSILLEDDTNKVFTRRFSEFQEYHKSGVPKKVRDKCDSETKVGKFDIVIYKKQFIGSVDNYRSFCVIEVKNLNRNYNSIKKDIVRIEEMHKNEKRESTFGFGISTFSLRPAKRDWENLANENRTSIEKYQKRVEQKLGIDTHNKIAHKVVFCRYSDPEYPVLKYLYIIFCILV